MRAVNIRFHVHLLTMLRGNSNQLLNHLLLKKKKNQKLIEPVMLAL